MLKHWKHFLRCVRGATAIEYALIASGIALAIAVIVFTVGTDLAAKYTEVDGTLK